ncbi:unnamed protein product [Ceratitis capitata]|uniref:(Mediterranean fruit fly) hypothetical protein n=1 Tax=Ceratitis capitata TaxID=7213 RepID=A0A811V4Q9_CERCA|nr:unnamed protein product [Ceratitis capitata]
MDGESFSTAAASAAFAAVALAVAITDCRRKCAALRFRLYAPKLNDGYAHGWRGVEYEFASCIHWRHPPSRNVVAFGGHGVWCGACKCQQPSQNQMQALHNEGTACHSPGGQACTATHSVWHANGEMEVCAGYAEE